MRHSRTAQFSALLLALALTALNLRPALTSAAPVMERIVNDLNLSRATAGLVTTIPVLLMGLLAPLAPVLANRWTQERVLAGTLALLTLALLVRGFSQHSVLWLLVSACGAGISIAIAGPLLSGFIKQHFKRRMNIVIAVYSVSLTLGAALAIATTLSITSLLGENWALALASWALLALAGLIIWCRVVPLPAQQPQNRLRSEPLPLRSRQAWLLTAFFACQSGIFYALGTWLVAHYEHVGFESTQASLLASLFMGFGVPGALLLPLLVIRVKDKRWLLMAVTGVITLMIVLIAWFPYWQPWLVNSVLGITSAGTFALVLALPVIESRDPRQAASLTAMMLSAGYLLGGVAPSLVGIGRDLSSGYALPFSFLAALSAVMVVLSLLLKSSSPTRDTPVDRVVLNERDCR